MQYRISIITVSYNAERFLQATIDSVKEQTYENLEFIIIDGNSTDNTHKIINSNRNILSKVLIEPDKGIYDAMNKGLDLATGDFVIFMGAGDQFYKNNILETVNSKISSPDYVYYGNVFIKELNTKYWGKFNSYKLALGNICHQAIFYPKCIYKNRKYNINYRIFADYDYNISIFKSTTFIYIDEIISYYDYNGLSSTTRDFKFEKDVKSIIKENLGILQFVYRIMYHSLKRIKRKLWK